MTRAANETRMFRCFDATSYTLSVSLSLEFDLHAAIGVGFATLSLSLRNVRFAEENAVDTVEGLRCVYCARIQFNGDDD